MPSSALVHEQFDWSVTTPSIAVIETVASIENVDPIDISVKEDMPLSDYIDPDALDTLVANTNLIFISFTVEDYKVEIDGEDLTIYAD